MSSSAQFDSDSIKTTANQPPPVVSATAVTTGFNRSNMQPVGNRNTMPVGQREIAPVIGADQIHALKPLFFKDQTKRAQYETKVSDELKSTSELQTQVTDETKEKAEVLAKVAQEEKERTVAAGETPGSAETQTQTQVPVEDKVPAQVAQKERPIATGETPGSAESQTQVTDDAKEKEAVLDQAAKEEKERAVESGDAPSESHTQSLVKTEE